MAIAMDRAAVRVVVADDSAFMRRMLTSVVQAKGFEVEPGPPQAAALPRRRGRGVLHVLPARAGHRRRRAAARAPRSRSRVTRTEVIVRMGELAASADTAGTLVSLALGSCIGVAMVDRRRTLAGLAHVMLPESPAGGPGDGVARFADTAVPELLRQMTALGAVKTRLEVSIVGGAQMFSFANDATAVGRRNEAGVRSALERLRLPIRSSCTGGKAGRTVRVDVGTGEVFVKEAGGKPFLLGPGTVLGAAA